MPLALTCKLCVKVHSLSVLHLQVKHTVNWVNIESDKIQMIPIGDILRDSTNLIKATNNFPGSSSCVVSSLVSEKCETENGD